MLSRRYCWRVGLAWEQEDGSTCEECGAPWGRGHLDVYDLCGAYLPNKVGLYGHHCGMKAGHEGPHDAS